MTDCANHNKCIEKALQDAESICTQKNIRFTDLRKKVFEIISAKHRPIKAYDILKLLQKDDSSAKPTTVYRALNFLLENGLVHKLHISNSYIACSNPKDKHSQSYFLICDKCNIVKEFYNNDLITDEIIRIADNNNFKTSNISIEIKGTCNNCS